MKTNQIMIRENLVEQRTSDSYFNANVTVNNWNLNNPSATKKLADFKVLKSTKDFIEHLKDNESIENPIISGKTGTWMHPLLYIDFCMWISLEFKTMALKFVLDGLIKTRHSAGDFYNEMSAAIMERHIEVYGCKAAPMVYIEEAKLINEIAGFGKIPRNEMSEKQLEKITILQKVNTNLIKKGVGKVARKNHLDIISESL